MWKRSHGRTSEAPPDERGGYRYVRDLPPLRHISTLRYLAVAARSGEGPFAYPLRTPTIAHTKPVFCCVRDQCPGKPPEGKLDGGEGNDGGQGFGEVLEVLGDTPASSELGEGTLDHPAARQDDEALHIVATLDDLHAHRGHRARGCQHTMPRSRAARCADLPISSTGVQVGAILDVRALLTPPLAAEGMFRLSTRMGFRAEVLA
jgi:hypothetical protein